MAKVWLTTQVENQLRSEIKKLGKKTGIKMGPLIEYLLRIGLENRRSVLENDHRTDQIPQM